MELWRRQKNKIRLFGLFLTFMLLCTLISRSVYASALPQVDTERPQSSAIAHVVEADGVVEAGGQTAVTVLSGLRCEAVLVHEGDRVDADTALFRVDRESLEEKIETYEREMERLRLEIQAQEQNRQLEARQRDMQRQRAQEAYDSVKDNSDLAVKRAEDDLASASSALSEAEREFVAWQNAQKESQPEQPEQTDQLEQPGQTEPPAETEAQPSEGETAESTAAAAGGKSEEDWEAELASLRQAVETAKRTLEDARRSRDGALAEAAQNIEDAQGEPAADSSLEINRLNLAAIEEEQQGYRELLEADGLIFPEKEGIVTSLLVSPGEWIPDGAAVMMADLDSPLRFVASLTEQDRRYVSRGDAVSLKLGSSRRKAAVAYLEESEQNPGEVKATILLDEGEGQLGQSGTLLAEKRSDTYACVVPLEAVHTDANQRRYVYVMGQRSGILGAEYIARKVYVNILDQNASQAALEEGAVGADEEVITAASAELADGIVVRYRE